MFSLAVSSARYQWRNLLGSAVALACGIGLLSATLLVIVSAQPHPPTQYADADIVVASEVLGETYNSTPVRRPWDESAEGSMVARLGRVDGVVSVIPSSVFPAQLVEGDRVLTPTDRDDPLGHNISSSALGGNRLIAGSPPVGAGQIVAPESSGLGVGDSTALVTAAGRTDVIVAGLAQGRSVYVDDATARTLSGGATTIGVILDEGVDTDSVRAEFAAIVGASGDVLTGDDLVAIESSSDRGARNIGSQLLGAMGLLAATITVFIVATTFAFTVTQRRRELGLLRAVGATPGQVRRMLLAEAVVIGAVSSVVGSVLGCALAPMLGGWMRDAGMLPAGWELSMTVIPVLASTATGLGVAVTGVWFASRRATRVQPMESLREAQAERSPMTRVRWIAGGAGVVGAFGFAALGATSSSGGSTASVAVAAVMSAIIGATALGPVYLSRLIRVFVWGSSPTAELVRAESSHGVRRVSSVLSPILVLAGFAVMLTGLIDTMDKAFGETASAAVPSELVVSPGEGSPALPLDVVDTVQSYGGSVIAPVATMLVYGDRAMDVWGIDTVALSSMGLTTDEGSVDDLAPGTVVLDVDAASRLGAGVGATVRTVFPDGEEEPLEVVAVVSGGPAFSYVDTETALAHDPVAMTPLLYVDGVEQAALTDALAGTGVRVETPAQYESAGNAEDARLLRLFELALVGLSLGFAALAVANTMLMATSDRRPAFTLLQRIGATRRQILGVVAVEAAVVAVIGAVLGAALAWPALAGVAAGLADDLGTPVSLEVRWSAVVGVGAVSLVIGLVSAVVPAMRAMRPALTR